MEDPENGEPRKKKDPKIHLIKT